MLRALAALTALLSICTAFVAAAPGTSEAAPVKATLTAAEFVQLSTQVADLQTALAKKDVNWNVANAACRKAGRSTALLRSQRKYCLESVATTRAVYALESHSLKCAADARGAATTPTTTTTPAATTSTPVLTTTPSPTTTLTTTTPTTATTGVSAQQLKDVSCLNREYQTIGRVAPPFYRAMVANRKLVLARGFKGICFKVLGDSAANARKVEASPSPPSMSPPTLP